MSTPSWFNGSNYISSFYKSLKTIAPFTWKTVNAKSIAYAEHKLTSFYISRTFVIKRLSETIFFSFTQVIKSITSMNSTPHFSVKTASSLKRRYSTKGQDWKSFQIKFKKGFHC